MGALAGSLTLLLFGVWLGRLARTGLALEVRAQTGGVLVTHGHANLGTSRTDAWRARGVEVARAVWTGQWIVPDPGFSELVLKSDGQAQVHLDDVAVLSVGSDGALGGRSRAFVPAGVHRLRVDYRPGSGPTHEVFLKGVTPEGRSVRVERRDTLPPEPSTPDAAWGGAFRLLQPMTLVAWLAFLFVRLREGAPIHLSRGVLAVLVCLVTLVALSFRFEALAIGYWGGESPDWADALASEIRELRPGAFEHTQTLRPYEGDPFSYLTIARSMGPFYEPSAREPLFPWLTRLALSLAGGRDIGISFLSALSSTLVCLAIFGLGSRLLSPWTGLLAALLWAIDWEVILFSVQGWRDDLFSLEVAVCAAALISLHLKPSRRCAAVLGIAGGLTLLTRLSALTFLIPGLLAAVLLPGPVSRGDRARAAGESALWMLLLAGPFMAACAIGFGDPFHAVNVHAAFYSRRAGQEGVSSNVMQLFSTLLSPWRFLETGFAGLTSYPFSIKWTGLGALFPGLGEVAKGLALASLPILLWRREGLIAIVVFVCSILPYAWTWNIPGGGEWRFTLPIYPLYLVSAAVAGETLFRTASGLLRKASRRQSAVNAGRYLVTGALLAVSFLWVSRWLDWLRVAEEIGQRRPALIEPGWQAGFFFKSGWTWTRPAEKAAAALAGSEGYVRLPVPEGVGARVVMRLGSIQQSGRPVEIFLGQRRLGSVSGSRDRGGIASIDLEPGFPRSWGFVELRFLREGPSNDGPPLTLLWLRIEPIRPGP